MATSVSVAAANFQAFAADTLAGLQQQQPAVASANWWEPLASKATGQSAKQGGQAVAALTTLYRSPDIHARIVAMSKWFFPHDKYNTLLQMVGECYGNGRLVEPTFTLLEGQAIANSPIFAGKAQEMGITAFYDYVFTIDWMAHRLDLVENILNALQGIGRGAGNLGDVRFFQEQLDSMLMSPHRVSWYMWDNPDVRKILVDTFDGKPGKIRSTGEQVPRTFVQFLSAPIQQVERFKDYADGLSKQNIEYNPDGNFLEQDEIECIRLAAQEAILLSSPLWNELCSIGQGLYRIYLTRAVSDIGRGNGPVSQGAFVNAFQIGTPLINCLPSRLDTESGYVLPIGTREYSFDQDSFNATKDNLLTYFSDDFASVDQWPDLSALSSYTFIEAENLDLKQLNASTVVIGLLQPKITDFYLFAHVANRWTNVKYLNLLVPSALQDKYTQDKQTYKTDEYQLWQKLLDSQKHTGTGGAIGTYICNGTDVTGRFLVMGPPGAMVVNSQMVENAMRAQTHHPIRFCADLADAMRRGVSFSAADMAAAKLDAFYQPKAGPQNVFEHLRARLRELENRYALIRNVQANANQHPVATADQIFTDDFLGYGPHAKLPQCPAGTLPMIFDSIHKQQLTPEQWQKQIVRINGEPLLPAHLQVQGCLPARRADPDPNPITSTTNVFQGLMGLLKS
jgi:hypothetical protein